MKRTTSPPERPAGPGQNEVLVAVGLWIGSEFRRDMSESEAVGSLRSFLARAAEKGTCTRIAAAATR